MTDNQQPLSGQQVQAMQKQLGEALQTAIKNMELRKYAMTQACEIWVKCDLARDPPVAVDEHGKMSKIAGFSYTPVELATTIYDFLVAPAAEVRVTIKAD